MLRASARLIQCEAAVPYVECNTAALNGRCLATLAAIALIAERLLLIGICFLDVPRFRENWLRVLPGLLRALFIRKRD